MYRLTIEMALDKIDGLLLLNKELKKENLRLQKKIAKLEMQVISAKNETAANRKAPAPINPILLKQAKIIFGEAPKNLT